MSVRSTRTGAVPLGAFLLLIAMAAVFLYGIHVKRSAPSVVVSETTGALASATRGGSGTAVGRTGSARRETARGTDAADRNAISGEPGAEDRDPLRRGSNETDAIRDRGTDGNARESVEDDLLHQEPVIPESRTAASSPARASEPTHSSSSPAAGGFPSVPPRAGRPAPSSSRPVSGASQNPIPTIPPSTTRLREASAARPDTGGSSATATAPASGTESSARSPAASRGGAGAGARGAGELPAARSSRVAASRRDEGRNAVPAPQPPSPPDARTALSPSQRPPTSSTTTQDAGQAAPTSPGSVAIEGSARAPAGDGRVRTGALAPRGAAPALAVRKARELFRARNYTAAARAWNEWARTIPEESWTLQIAAVQLDRASNSGSLTEIADRDGLFLLPPGSLSGNLSPVCVGIYPSEEAARRASAEAATVPGSSRPLVKPVRSLLGSP